MPPARRKRDVAEWLRQAGVSVFRYGPGAQAAAEALEVLDVRQDDLTGGGGPLAGKQNRRNQSDGAQG